MIAVMDPLMCVTLYQITQVIGKEKLIISFVQDRKWKAVTRKSHPGKGN